MSGRSKFTSGTRVQQLTRVACAVLALGVCGCAVGPNFKRPAAPPVTHYSTSADPTETVAAEGVVQRFTPGAQVTADWWRLFGSIGLDAVIAEALAKNPTVAAAEDSLRQSQDSLRSGYGIFYPQIAAEADATRQRFNALKIGDVVPASTIFNLFTLGASVSYALDVWGGERRMIEGLRAQVDLQRATEEAAYVSLAANICNTVIARAAYRAEVDATSELIALQREQVHIGEVQAEAGTVPYANVLLLRSQLDAYEATIPQLQVKLAQSEDLLATLAGELPAGWHAPQIALSELTLPADLPVSLPSDLVRQRPDILVAEAAAHAASANVGVATAAMLPSITLSADYAANSVTTNQLFAANGRSWSVGADLTAPLFQGGTLWYHRKAAIDSYQQAMHLYRQTVLNAFAQVADTLQALAYDAATLRAQKEALASASEALHLVQTTYAAGLSTYLEVLIADTQYHQAKINELQAVAVRYQDTVALYVALGGGWWNANRDTAATITQAPAEGSSIP